MLRFARNSHTFLLLFVHSAVHRLLIRGTTGRRYLLVSDSSPMVDLGSLVLLMSIFGAKVAVIYVVFGLIVAVIGGTLIEKMGTWRSNVESFILTAGSVDIESPDLTKKTV